MLTQSRTHRCMLFAKPMRVHSSVSAAVEGQAEKPRRQPLIHQRAPTAADINLRIQQLRKPLDLKMPASVNTAVAAAPKAQENQMKLGFIGCGAMGGAILREVLAKKLVAPEDVVVAEMMPEVREKLSKELGVKVTDNASEAIAHGNVVMVSVKPHQIKDAMSAARDVIDSQLFISIAAGVTLDTLESTTQNTNARWARVMPNVACLVGESSSTYFPSKSCTEKDIKRTESILNSCGVGTRLQNEALLDAATGVAGSGIAYIFLVIEGLADGGVRAGLPRNVAMQLATQTVLGAASLQKSEGTHPGQLKDMVCSPGGTTIEAVASLERAGLRTAMIEAVHAAHSKAQELGAKAKNA